MGWYTSGFYNEGKVVLLSTYLQGILLPLYSFQKSRILDHSMMDPYQGVEPLEQSDNEDNQ